MAEKSELLAPRARTSGLIVRELDGEVLIFDVTGNQAHCLNGVAGAVWKRCDGGTTVSEIAAMVGSELGSSADTQ